MQFTGINRWGDICVLVYDELTHVSVGTQISFRKLLERYEGELVRLIAEMRDRAETLPRGTAGYVPNFGIEFSATEHDNDE